MPGLSREGKDIFEKIEVGGEFFGVMIGGGETLARVSGKF